VGGREAGILELDDADIASSILLYITDKTTRFICFFILVRLLRYVFGYQVDNEFIA